jgi:hypothetical protein
MQNFLHASQSNWNHRHTQAPSDQTDAWLERLDFSPLCALPFWEEQYGPILGDKITNVPEGFASASFGLWDGKRIEK